MIERKKETPSVVVFCAIFLSATFPVCFSAAKQLESNMKMQTRSPNRFGSSLVFPVQGDVYPNGFFNTTIYLGNPPMPYSLDIDTGSNLTWVQCAAAPGAKLLEPAPNKPYKPNNNVLLCEDPFCASVDQPTNYPCRAPKDQCDYEVHYADSFSSLGVLVRDSILLCSINHRRPTTLVFGCGFDQEFSGQFPPPYVDGVLGLANGKSGIVSQLSNLGLTRNVIGHCFSGKGEDGFLFFGDDLVPPGLVWAPMLSNSLNQYLSGPVNLLFGDKSLVANGLFVVFDSGSTYTYLNPQAYQATLSRIKTALLGKPLTAVQDGSLPVCWKGATPFYSIDAVKKYFGPLVLIFTNAKNVAFVLPPEAYLLITSHGNVCLGILNGAEAELENLNVIGDISLLGKLVVLDNERQMIGWIPFNCRNIPNLQQFRGQVDVCASIQHRPCSVLLYIFFLFLFYVRV